MAGLPREFLRFSVFNVICLLVCFVAEGMGLLVGAIFNVTVLTEHIYRMNEIFGVYKLNNFF